MQLYPALVSILALIMYMVFTVNVGKARGRCLVQAPAVSGNQEFERYYRVQMNTLEQLIVFLPALWIFSTVVYCPLIASAIGMVWIIGRILYALGYYKDVKKRFAGFVISIIATSALLLGSLGGILLKVFGLYV
ncbi:MAG: MAPEG family protein [Pseudomonadota bacterium]